MEWHLGDRDKRAHPRSRGENRGPFSPHGSELGSSPLTRGKPVELQTGARLGGLIPAHAGKTVRPMRIPRPSSAHPRSRGENSVRLAYSPRSTGSSPLTRGKPVAGLAHEHTRGLIPAHAGKTCRDAMSRSISWAHPRSRGENTTVNRPSTTGEGSSPLTRGKRRKASVQSTSVRLIPAHAGKTVDDGDQPIPRTGSSPLTRGKPPHGAPDGTSVGLIPAHAGKTDTALTPTGLA